MRTLSREALEAEVERLRAQQHGNAAGPFDQALRSSPAGREMLMSAVEKTRMPMILTDPNLPDDPIVFANRAFLDLCGYSADELVGRNCRFLQGSGTDQDQVQRIRDALKAKRDIALDLLNYHRDGTPFLNELYISPVLGADGRVLYHFGSQLDVTGYRQDRLQLENTERRLRAVFASAVDVAIIATDGDGLVTDWNTGACAIFGWTAEEMRGQSADRFFTPEDRSSGQVSAEMRLAREHGRATDERWHLRKDGSRFWAAGEMMPLHAEDGTRLGFLKIVRDRTAEHKAGVALARSEERYRSLFDSMDEGFCIIEFIDGPHGPFGDYVHVEANPACERHLGIAHMVGQSLRNISPDEAEGWLDIYREVWRTGRLVRFEREFKANGRHLEVAAHRVEGAERPQVAVLFQDITARRQAESSLRASEAARADGLTREVAARTEERDRMWDTSPDLMLVIDFDGVFRRVNPAWTPLLGYAPDELVGHHVNEFVLPEDHADTISAVSGAAAGGQPRIVNRYRHKDGSTRWISWSGAPAGMVTYATGRDITAEKEQSLMLEATAEALRQSQKMEAVGQLTGGVAHDFNNLLTIIRSSVDLLRRPNLAEERRARYMDAVSDTVDRAAKLTGQLLAFARRQTLKPEVLDVGERLRAVADMLDTVTGARVKVRTELPDRPCFIEADLSQFETALINMAVNARDAMGGEGTLTLRLDAGGAMPPIRGHGGGAGKFARIDLSDTGSGIAPGDLARIFEPFFTTKEVGKGTGLGLSQVFGFAKQSGGDVDVHSVVAQGTTFTLYLPEVDAKLAREATDDQDGPAPGGSGLRVLVVEDNIEVGRFATQILEDLGYATEWAANAEAALERLDGDGAGFDAVFSDVVMPGMGGLAMAKELRRRLPRLPVVLASGYSHVLAEKGDHGFELLHKPYSADQLSRVLHRVVSGRSRG